MPPPQRAARAPSLIAFTEHAPTLACGVRQWTARGQNFSVEWLEGTGDDAAFTSESSDEAMVLVLDGPLSMRGETVSADAPARSICILPPGRCTLRPAAGTTCVLLTSLRGSAASDALNEGAYAERDDRVRPVGAAYRPLRAGAEIRILSIDAVSASKDKPRLKMLQTATLSINWVEYDGPRNRAELSPHAHSAFEQGSLAIAGDFVHHMRVEWGADANLWQPDRHEKLGSPSLLVVPVGIIHTSEGVGGGRHLLIDIFSPPRSDFIANGWVANAHDYEPPAEAE